MVIKLDALGDSNIIGSRFLEGALDVVIVVGVPRNRDKKYCFAASETNEKSVGFVPRRIVRRDVIVRSLEWIRRTVVLRPLTGTCVFVGVGSIIVADLSSTIISLESCCRTNVIGRFTPFKPS